MKWWIVVLALSAVSLAGIAFYMLVGANRLPNRQTETSNPITLEATCEQRYSTVTFGYEFCYPTGWYLREFGQDKETVGVDKNQIPEASEYAGMIVVTTHAKKSSAVVSQVRERLDKPTEERTTVSENDATEIAGKIKSDDAFFAGQELTSIIASRGRYAYEITLMAEKGTFENNKPTFNALLASWKWLPITKPAPFRSTSGNLVVEQPIYEAAIVSPLTIKGSVRAFEAAFLWRIKDKNGTVIVSGSGTGSGGEAGELQPFSISVRFSRPSPPDPGTLEVYTRSAQGAEQDLVSIPVKFQ